MSFFLAFFLSFLFPFFSPTHGGVSPVHVQVMCLFSWAHLLVYCVLLFLPSYRLFLAGHFSPLNPVRHILVLESVK